MILLLYLNQFYKTEQVVGSSPNRNSCCIVSGTLFNFFTKLCYLHHSQYHTQFTVHMYDLYWKWVMQQKIILEENKEVLNLLLPKTCEPNRLLHSRSAVQYMKYFIYNFTFNPYGLHTTHKWPPPNVSAFIAQLVGVSHRYHEVTGSNPVEVLTFSGFYICNCMNCFHNCEDHRLLDFPSTVQYMKYFI